MTAPDRAARLTVTHVGPESAAALLGVVHAAFAGRPALDPPADALGETAQSLAERLVPGGGLLATYDGEPAGAVVLDPATGPDGVLWLRRFGVDPRARAHGVARALLDAAGVRAEELGCTRLAVQAREELPDTIAFWERRGFDETGRAAPYVVLEHRLPRTRTATTAEDLRALGSRLAPHLRRGDLVLLTGELGAGKTTFTQGLGEGLGVRGGVTSPTFVIARVHPSLADGPALVHVDAYRLGGLDELDDLDLDTSLDDAVTVVEWGEGIAEGLAESRLEVHVDRATGDPAPDSGPDPDGPDPRWVRLHGIGPRWHDLPSW